MQRVDAAKILSELSDTARRAAQIVPNDFTADRGDYAEHERIAVRAMLTRVKELCDTLLEEDGDKWQKQNKPAAIKTNSPF